MDQHNLQGVKGDKICFLSERLELFNKKGLYHKFFPLPFPTFLLKQKLWRVRVKSFPLTDYLITL